MMTTTFFQLLLAKIIIILSITNILYSSHDNGLICVSAFSSTFHHFPTTTITSRRRASSVVSCRRVLFPTTSLTTTTTPTTLLLGAAEDAAVTAVTTAVSEGTGTGTGTGTGGLGLEDAAALFTDDIVLFDPTIRLIVIGFGILVILVIGTKFILNSMDVAIENVLYDFENTMKSKYESRWINDIESKLVGLDEQQRSQKLFEIMEQLQETDPDFMSKVNRDMTGSSS